jgi:hypothetical protein
VSRAIPLRLRRRPGLVSRDLGASIVVMDPDQQTAYTLRDEAADLWRATSAVDDTVASPGAAATPAVAALIEKGLVVPVGLTRRAVLSRVAVVGGLAAGAALIDSISLPAVAAHASVPTHTYVLGTSMATYIASHPATDAAWASPTTGFPFLFYVLNSITVGATSITQGTYSFLNRYDSKSATQPGSSYTGSWSIGTPGGSTVVAPYLGYSTLFGSPAAVAVTTATTGLGLEFLTQTTNASASYSMSFTVAANAPVSIYVCNASTGALYTSHSFATGSLSYTYTLPTSLTVGVPAPGIIVFPNAGAAKGSTVALSWTVTD